MQFPIHRRRLLTTAWILASLPCGSATLWAQASATTAQSMAGSETHTSLAAQAVGGGGASSSSSYQTQAELNAAFPAAASASETFQLEPGVTWLEPVLGSDQPVIFSVTPASGAASGGTPTVVRGLNFTAPGAGNTSISVAGFPASGVQVLSPTELQLITPPGVDGIGNPLGSASLELSNDLGSSQAPDGFQYLPAVYLLSPAQLGDPLNVRLATAPGAIALMWFGLPIPGLPPLTLPGYDGAAPLLLDLTFLLNGVFVPTGELTLPVLIPSDPLLVGASVDLQALAVTDPFTPAGSFTNVLNVPISL